MPDLGLEVLLKGKNAVRLLGGLWVALRVSLISVAISIPQGILLGVLMTRKNRLIRAILRIYLEIIRIMPQMVLLFLAYFGTARAFGWNLDGETAAIIVFALWGTAEMSDLVRGAPVRKRRGTGTDAGAGIPLCGAAADGTPAAAAVHQSHHPHDKNHQPDFDDRRGGGAEGSAADH